MVDELQTSAPSHSRWTEIPFPPYRYVPGRTPHPRTHPEGHSYGKPEEIHPPWNPAEWKTLERYLYGIDLYNYAYFWEAHEALESLWRAAEPSSVKARFMQGLIQIAAANLHCVMEHKESACSQAEKGLSNLTAAGSEGPIYMGIEIEKFSSDAQAYFAGRSSRPLRIDLME